MLCCAALPPQRRWRADASAEGGSGVSSDSPDFAYGQKTDDEYGIAHTRQLRIAPGPA
jgi:hypothetical protein